LNLLVFEAVAPVAILTPYYLLRSLAYLENNSWKEGMIEARAFLWVCF
jgi:hypothetical protein